MTPIVYKGDITIPVAILSKSVLNYFVEILPLVMTGIICVTVTGTILTKIFKPEFILKIVF